MKTSRKFMVATLVLSLAMQIALPTRRAHAFVAAISGGSAIPALIVMGAGLGVETIGIPVGLVAAFATSSANNDQEDQGVYGAVYAGIPYLVGALSALVGVVMLDASHPDSLAFAPLTPADAGRLGVTAAEREAFNEELPEINAIAETVGKDLAVSGRMNSRFAGQRWAAYAGDGAISPESLSTIGKISSHYSTALHREMSGANR